MKNFVIYRWVEIVFILTGLLLIFLFKSNPDKTFWYGFGVALAMQAVIMLGADYFAEQRGKIYNEELQKMIS
jgi:4-amino-4-deoxy-L-arabinose transferase-like glycosyltransferase